MDTMHLLRSRGRRPTPTTRGWWTMGIFMALMLLADKPNAGMLEGENVYRQHCESCHGPDGRPPIPGVPDFTSGEGLMQPDQVLMSAIRDGKSTMPGYYGVLTDEEMIDVLLFIRTFF